jgi:F-type H+/Na+-transporting ATPase subunit alpha
MTEDISGPQAWLEHQKDVITNARVAPQAYSIGRVEKVGDGIARVSGLPDVRLNELLKFDNGRLGFTLTLDENDIGAVLLDDAEDIAAGSEVRGTGDVVKVPVGKALLGRILDPLGRPLDGGGAIEATDYLPAERPAPTIIERELVSEPLETGILVVDALFAVGRGQRELIIGDRATGKTSIGVDAIINQKHSKVISVYVAIGQRASDTERVIAAVKSHGAPERCIFVVAAASSSAGLQWIAPFCAFSMAEYFRDRGEDVLIVIDDLTKHAATHRELALLTREPPGREAYPGDIFYLHARLLERAAKLSADLGGGSITALPIAQTEAGNLSAYIPTNLISITDGQIVLSTRLLALDQRPAVDVGLSVSRVGGKAQKRALRDVSGRVRLDYSQFLELEMFTRFGGISDTRVKAEIQRGKRIRSLLTQPRFANLRLCDQVALLAALDDGVFDAYPAELIPLLRDRLPGWLDGNASQTIDSLQKTGKLDADTRTSLAEAVGKLARDLASTLGKDAKS